MSETAAERVAEIRARHAYRQASISEQMQRLGEGFEPCPAARSLEEQGYRDFDALLARVEELEAALRPFAAAADGITPEMVDSIPIARQYEVGLGSRRRSWSIEPEAFRAARAALSPDSDP